MAYYEIDLIEAGEKGSGDAIALRYADDSGVEMVHVVDGGYQTTDDGQKLLDIIASHYVQKDFIDHVVLTHSDQDHASGLRTVVEQANIGTLWMNRPWLFVDTLLPLFHGKYTREGLIQRLKKDYSHVAELEEIAERRGITINSAFQSDMIGSFMVLAPSVARYVHLVAESEKTPPVVQGLISLPQQIISTIRSWGHENLKGDTDGTSHENEMSIIQYSVLAGDKILLTGDAGVEALEEAHQYATAYGIPLPGLDLFQLPHHGGRRNLSTPILDKWLGEPLQSPLQSPKFTAIACANRHDDAHPRKAVRRAIEHRGGGVSTTKGREHIYRYKGLVLRENFTHLAHEPYPQDMED